MDNSRPYIFFVKKQICGFSKNTQPVYRVHSASLLRKKNASDMRRKSNTVPFFKVKFIFGILLPSLRKPVNNWLETVQLSNQDTFHHISVNTLS